MELSISLSLLAFLAIFLIFYGLDRALSQPDAISSRLDRYASRAAAQSGAATSNIYQPRIFRGLNRIIVGGSARPIISELARADLKLTPAEYVLLNFASTLVGFLLLLLIGRGSLILGLIGGVIGFYVPRFYLRYLQGKRLNAFNNQLGDTLILLANSLRSGYSLLQSMETVSKELPQPISVEFARVTREIGLGLTIQEALDHMLERINSDDLDLIITAIDIQHEVGGNLAEILDTIAHTIRERVRIKGQIRALTASQRLSGNIVALLPIALGFVLFLINPAYISNLFQESCGIMMLIFSGVTIATGYYSIRKIVQIEV